MEGGQAGGEKGEVEREMREREQEKLMGVEFIIVYDNTTNDINKNDQEQLTFLLIKNNKKYNWGELGAQIS